MTTQKDLTTATIPLLQKGNFCRYFSTMLRSGTPILEAVEMLTVQAEDKTFKEILKEVSKDLEKGRSLATGLERFKGSFDTLFITVIKAGEKSGTLDKSLEYLGKQVIGDYYLLQKVKGAFMYPAVIISTMLVMGFIVFGFVLPRIAKVFLSSGFNLPIYTKVLFNGSLFFQDHFFLVISVIAGIFASITFYFLKGKGTETVRKMLPKIPVIKKIFENLDIARFGKILGTLLQSGVPITEGLRITLSSLTLEKFSALGPVIEADIAKGLSLKDSFAKHTKIFPAMVTGMIAIGEETGNLDKILFDIADFYEQEVGTSLQNFVTVLEPAITVIIGIGVAVMVLSIIAPIYSIIGNIQVK